MFQRVTALVMHVTIQFSRREKPTRTAAIRAHKCCPSLVIEAFARTEPDWTGRVIFLWGATA